jgi:signal transduction histidine kinase
MTVHELRRPLTVITSYAQLLSGGMLGEVPAGAMTAVESMVEAAEAMLHLIEGLAEVVRLGDPADPVVITEVAVDQLLEQVLADVAPMAMLRGVQLEIDAAEGLRVRGDARRLALALGNLCTNAVSYSAESTTVQVTARGDGTDVVIAVRDRGPGVPPEEEPRIFDKYYRGRLGRREHPTGSGLGLFLARAVAEGGGGSLTAGAAEGGGMEFTLRLPRAEPA